MKYINTFLLLLAMAIYVDAAESSRLSTASRLSSRGSASAQPLLSKYRSTTTPPSEEQCAELYTTHADEKSGRSYEFTAGARRLNLDPRRYKSKIARYKKSGKVPFRVTADFIETKTIKGKKRKKRASGSAKIFVLDSAGKLVVKKSASISTLCPG